MGSIRFHVFGKPIDDKLLNETMLEVGKYKDLVIY